MHGNNGDNLIETTPDKSFLLFIRDNFLSQSNRDLSKNNNQFLFNLFNINPNNLEKFEVKKDILTGNLSNKIEKLRNMVLVNNAILNGSKKTFNQKIMSFSGKKNNDIVSDNMVYFVKYIRQLIGAKEHLFEKTFANWSDQKLRAKIESLNRILFNDNAITNVINLAVTPDENRGNEINIKDLQELFIKNAPDNMKIHSNLKEPPILDENNLEDSLYKLFEINKEKVAFNLLQKNFLDLRHESYSQIGDRIYKKLRAIKCVPHDDVKYITNKIRREIITDELKRIFSNEKLIKEFTNYLSLEESNNIIQVLLSNRDEDELSNEIIRSIVNIISNRIDNGTLFLQRYIDYCQNSKKLLDNISKKDIDIEEYLSVMGDFSSKLYELIEDELNKVSESENIKTMFSNILELFNSLNSSDVQSWFKKNTPQYQFINRFVESEKKDNGILDDNLFKIINSLKEGSSFVGENSNKIKRKNKEKAENAIAHNVLGTILDNIDNGELPQIINCNDGLVNRNCGYVLEKIDTLIKKEKIYDDLGNCSEEDIKYIKENVVNLDVKRVINSIKSVIDSIESKNNAKEKIFEFIKEYNKKIQQNFMYIKGKYNSLQSMYIPEFKVAKCAEIFINFMIAQNKDDAKNMLDRMDAIDLASIFKGIIKEKINEQNEKIYQMSTSEFMRYTMNSIIVHTFIKVRNENYDHNLEEVEDEILDKLRIRALHCTNFNSGMGETNILHVSLGRELNNEQQIFDRIKLQEPQTQTIDIEFEDFSDTLKIRNNNINLIDKKKNNIENEDNNNNENDNDANNDSMSTSKINWSEDNDDVVVGENDDVGEWDKSSDVSIDPSFI